jgi:hypothetical protein
VKARITVSLAADGRLEIWLNAAGRDHLVRELQALNETNEHFHFGPADYGEVEVRTKAYQPTDTVFEHGKVLFRTDEWDKRYFPHVVEDGP